MPNNQYFHKILVIFILFLNSVVSAHNVQEKSFATSVAGLEQLLLTENILIENVDKYADKLQEKVNTLKNLVNHLKIENGKALQDSKKYLHIPLNAFSLIRRMHNDWNPIEMFMVRPVGENHLNMIRKHLPEMPTSKDITEASEAIYRLQDTYGMETDDVARGIFNGKQYDAKLSSVDCVFMGMHMYGKKLFHLAVEWFNRAIETYESSDYNNVINHILGDIYYLFGEALAQEYRFNDAIVAMEKARELLPQDARLLHRKNDIEMRAKMYDGSPVKHPKREPTDNERGCSGQYVNKPSFRLYCVYNTTTSAFLRLAPLKMEILHLDPYLVVFHDVISDAEIQELKTLAKPYLNRSTVYKDGKAVAIDRRTSKYAWFGDNFSNVTRRINQRIRDMTGFDIEGSEMLQVMNYGVGGHYDAHYDFFNASDTEDVVRETGDRIATVLFYMTDVEQGGATVFPKIETAVFPRKGSAVMWYNLNNKVVGDDLTLHAACPVIVGSKWICNKWIRSKAQIFRKPCYKE